MSTIPSPDQVRRRLQENRIESEVLRKQLKAAEELEQVRGRYESGETVEAKHCLPIGKTSDGLDIVAIVPPDTPLFDRQRLVEAKQARDFERIMEICAEIGGQVSTAKLLPEVRQ